MGRRHSSRYLYDQRWPLPCAARRKSDWYPRRTWLFSQLVSLNPSGAIIVKLVTELHSLSLVPDDIGQGQGSSLVVGVNEFDNHLSDLLEKGEPSDASFQFGELFHCGERHAREDDKLIASLSVPQIVCEAANDPLGLVH